MSATFARLLSEALLLPADTRTELVEAILEHSSPSAEFIAEQMEIVTARMENVRTGASALIPAEAAHQSVLHTLRARE